MELLGILEPDCHSLLSSGIFSDSDKVGASGGDVLTTSDRLTLGMPLPEPYSHSSLVLGSLELGAGIVQSLDPQSIMNPSVEELAEGLAIPHVTDSFKFVDSLSTVLDLLLLADGLLRLEFIGQILVIIHDVLTFEYHIGMHYLILLSLHLVECLGQSELVNGSDPLLHLILNVLVVGDILAPSLQCVTLCATPHIVEESHGIDLSLGVHRLGQ